MEFTWILCSGARAATVVPTCEDLAYLAAAVEKVRVALSGHKTGHTLILNTSAQICL